MCGGQVRAPADRHQGHPDRPLIEIVDEHPVQSMAGALSQLLDVAVSILVEFPHRLRRVRKERRFGAQQSLAPKPTATSREGTRRETSSSP